MPEVMAGYVRKTCRNNFLQMKDFLGKETAFICTPIRTDPLYVDVYKILHHAFKLRNIPRFTEENLQYLFIYSKC